MTKLQDFLATRKAAKDGSITHTSYFGGKYFISDDDGDTFDALYSAAVRSGEPLGLIEQHADLSPALVDLDFRWEGVDVAERRYTVQHKERLVNLYAKTLHKFLKVPDGMKIYVQEKPQPRVDKGILKDGLHMVVPGVVGKASHFLKMRDDMLANMGDILQDMGVTNSPRDVLDEAIIEKNGWTMLGSHKPDQPPYQVTGVYELTAAGMEMCDGPMETTPELIKLMSIRDKLFSTDALPSKKQELDEAHKAWRARKVKATKDQEAREQKKRERQEQGPTETTDADVILARDLVELLSGDRAEAYSTWMEVGWCLHNISPTHLLEAWTTFSARSSKYKQGECFDKWQSMDNGTLTMGSLHYWAKDDSPDEYVALMAQHKQDVVIDEGDQLFEDILSGAAYSVAKWVYSLYGDLHMCASIKTKEFYAFVGHRWEYSPDATRFSELLSNDVAALIDKRAREYMEQANTTTNEDMQKRLRANAKLAWGVADKLKTTSFKSSVITEFGTLSVNRNQGFKDRFDSNVDLLGFNNGVLDLRANTFRDGTPDDFVTMSTGYDYVHEDDHEIQANIMKFLQSTSEDEDMLRYKLRVKAYALNGRKYAEQIWFFTGTGRNGKGTEATLDEATFGKAAQSTGGVRGYYYQPNQALITAKTSNSSSPQPEKLLMRGVRITCMTEPEGQLNVAYMKEVSGNDPQTARGLYQTPITFMPQCSLFVQLNHMNLGGDVDDAFVMRLRVIDFPMKFVDPATYDASTAPDHHRPGDPNLKERFTKDVRYGQQYMRILHKVYNECNMIQGASIPEPKAVRESTREAMLEADPLRAFLASYVSRDKAGKMEVMEVFDEYCAWGAMVRIPDLYPMTNTKVWNRKTFMKAMLKNGLKTKGSNGRSYYYGHRLDFDMDAVATQLGCNEESDDMDFI